MIYTYICINNAKKKHLPRAARAAQGLGGRADCGGGVGVGEGVANARPAGVSSLPLCRIPKFRFLLNTRFGGNAKCHHFVVLSLIYDTLARVIVGCLLSANPVFFAARGRQPQSRRAAPAPPARAPASALASRLRRRCRRNGRRRSRRAFVGCGCGHGRLRRRCLCGVAAPAGALSRVSGGRRGPRTRRAPTRRRGAAPAAAARQAGGIQRGLRRRGARAAVGGGAAGTRRSGSTRRRLGNDVCRDTCIQDVFIRKFTESQRFFFCKCLSM
jgi:hypothetical protein